MTEYGQGFVTSEGQTSNDVVAMELGNNGSSGGVLQINSMAGSSPPDPVPAIAGLFSDLIAWQQNPGSMGPAEIRVRYEPRAASLGPELVVSDPTQGATDAARGLAAGGDGAGEAALAWVQGTGATTEIAAERLYQPPGAPGTPTSLSYVRTAQPVLSWSAASARWGPITYTVSLDGVQVGQTGGTTIQPSAPLPDGPHSWRVTASNPAGLSSTSRTVRVFVDTVAPRLTATLAGARRARATLTLRLAYRDVAPGSGVARVTIRWGDRTVTRLKPGTHRVPHAYRRSGRYRITIVVVDKAGNQTTVVKRLVIKKQPAAKKPAAGGRRR
jgi:hypothetical protein